MRSIVSIAILLIAAPAFAADAPAAVTAAPAVAAVPAPVAIQPAAPPSPPAVVYQVSGFKWSGAQWVKQPKHTLQTTDLQKAADYKATINSYAGWEAATNLPDKSYVHTVYNDPVPTQTRPSPAPALPTYSVWAFSLADNQWVKSDQYSWTTTDPVAGLKYAKRVNAVEGWTTTTNCPAPVPKAQRYVQGGMVRGAQNYAMRFNIGGFSINVPYSMLQNSGGGNDGGGSDSMYDSGNWPNYSDTSISDASTALQDAQNAQLANDNQQENLNEQQFENTENMINTQNEFINPIGP